MKKNHLSDVSILIPVRLDSIFRLENLMASVRYLSRNTDARIIVLHADRYDNGIIKKLLPATVEYHFVKDNDDVFYRTMYINMMVKMTNTPIIAVWDADVIIPQTQILKSVEDIRNGFDMSYPYDGHFYDTSPVIRDLYISERNISLLTKNTGKMNLIYGDDLKGGAFFANRLKYMNSGMENENFYGWGPEDYERYARWNVLGYRISRIRGNLYHLTHPRGANSTYRSQQQIRSTNREHMNTMCSSKEEILEHLSKNVL